MPLHDERVRYNFKTRKYLKVWKFYGEAGSRALRKKE